MILDRENWARTISGLIGFLVILPVLFLMFDNRKCISIVDAGVEPAELRVGDTAVLTWKVKEFHSCDGLVIRRLIDSAGAIHQFTTEETVFHKVETNGGTATFRKPLVIPPMVPGQAVYSPIVLRWRNSIQKLWPSVDPEVPLIKLLILPSK